MSPQQRSSAQRFFKTSNVLLDESLVAKLTDSGLV
jgi:hypothetical protein